MRQEFVMRGQTVSGQSEVLNFSGFKPGMAYKLTEFQLYPSAAIHGADFEYVGSITAGKTAVAPSDINFNDDGLIGTTLISESASAANPVSVLSVINDTFLITQNLILMVQDMSGSSLKVNWQCKFEAVKMSGSEEAVTNYKQFAISDS